MKKEEKEKAIELRKNGWFITKIAEELNVAKSSVSSWVRDIEVPECHKLQWYKCNQFDHDDAVDLFNQGVTLKEIALKVNSDVEPVKYWLRENGYIRKRKSHDCCLVCEKTNNKVKRKYCRSCQSSLTRYKNKIKAVRYLGGKCEKCGVEFEEKHYAAYEFHHKNPKEKDFQFSQLSISTWDRIEKEINKCMLVCSCCHRIIHSKMDGDLLEAALKMVQDD